MNKKLLEVIACPSCKGGLVLQDNELICQLDGLAFPVTHGIPVLLIEQARSIEAQ